MKDRVRGLAAAFVILVGFGGSSSAQTTIAPAQTTIAPARPPISPAPTPIASGSTTIGRNTRPVRLLRVPEETHELAHWLRDIRDALGITVVMVEHDMSLVSAVADRVLVMEQGQVLTSGTPAEVQSDPRVIAAYLGA